MEVSSNVSHILFCASPNSYNPFEGPNENPEAELPLTAGEYIYIYGNMDEDGFFEGRKVVGNILPTPLFLKALFLQVCLCILPSLLHAPPNSAFQTQLIGILRVQRLYFSGRTL